MKRITLVLAILLCNILQAYGQRNAGMKGTMNISRTEMPGVWDTVPGWPIHSSLQSIYDDNGTLTVAGTITYHYADDEYGYGIAEWNGNAWVASFQFAAGYVIALANYNDRLYAGGSYIGMNRNVKNGLARRSGSDWNDSNLRVDGIVYSLAAYKGEFYAAGRFSLAGKKNVKCIARWDGVNWNEVGKGMSSGYYSQSPCVTSMQVYNGNLIAAGRFDSAGGKFIRNIAQWNGESWVAMDSGLGTAYDEIWSLATYKNEIYAGGDFKMALRDSNFASGIARWDGRHWREVGGGVVADTTDKKVNNTPGVRALAVYEGELYAAGGFDMAGGRKMEKIARWNGYEWNNVGSLDSANCFIVTLCPFKGELYVGGNFDCTLTGTMGKAIHATSIAKWKVSPKEPTKK